MVLVLNNMFAVFSNKSLTEYNFVMPGMLKLPCGSTCVYFHTLASASPAADFCLNTAFVHQKYIFCLFQKQKENAAQAAGFYWKSLFHCLFSTELGCSTVSLNWVV